MPEAQSFKFDPESLALVDRLRAWWLAGPLTSILIQGETDTPGLEEELTRVWDSGEEFMEVLFDTIYGSNAIAAAAFAEALQAHSIDVQYDAVLRIGLTLAYFYGQNEERCRFKPPIAALELVRQEISRGICQATEGNVLPQGFIAIRPEGKPI